MNLVKFYISTRHGGKELGIGRFYGRSMGTFLLYKKIRFTFPETDLFLQIILHT